MSNYVGFTTSAHISLTHIALIRFFVNVCGILIDFQCLYEPKQSLFMLKSLYFSFAINTSS